MIATVGVSAPAARPVADIPQLSHREAGELSRTEYERLLAVLEKVEGDDWGRPTYCAAWNVRDMAAHLAGAVTASTSAAEFFRQYIRNGPLDRTNALQIAERAGKAPAEVVAEFRRSGLIAVANRQGLAWPLRKIRVPMDMLGFASFEYLMDTIYPRDQWMHRYDICAATGQTMVTTAEHDGRIVALVLRDIAKKLKQGLAGRTVALRLLGTAGGDYLFGRPGTPGCALEMDVFDFNLRASGRIAAAAAAGRTSLSGDQATAEWFLDNMEVPY
jgi:uncharacterized protein (TIGR03083 family)